MHLAHVAWTQLWQLTAVIVVVGAVAGLCRRRPHLAYALWMVVLVKALTPPLWSSNLSALAHVHAPAPPAWLAVQPAVDDAVSAADGEAASRTGGAPNDDALDADRAAAPTPPQVSSQADRQQPRTTGMPGWLALWLGGALGVTAIAAVAVVRRNRLLAAARPADGDVRTLVDCLARQLGVASPPVLVSDSNLGPAVCGIWKPALILPASILANDAAHTPAARLKPIIAHELVHLRRGDHVVVALQLAVQAAWWFHPLVWWANRRICRVRELCCDAEAVAALGEPPQRYARALLDMLDAKIRVRPVFGFPGVRPVEVTAARMKEILAMSDSILSRTPMSYWLAALVAAALVLPGGALAPAQESTDESASPTGTATSAADGAAASAAEGGTKEAASPARPVLLLKYGDNKPDGKKSIAGAGEMIRFQLPKGQTNDLKALRIHGSRYGYPQPPDEDVEINILSADMNDVLHTELVPYRLFKRQPEPRWMMIPFKEPVDVPETFWVVLNFNAEATKGVYVSYDTSTKGKYSRVGFNDQDAAPTKDKADWMVQAMLAK